MKLRCTKNSIRIRIKKSELDQLGSHGRVEESVQFGPNNTLTFTLFIDQKLEEVDAIFEDNSIAIALPLNTARKWITTNQVGIYYDKLVGDKIILQLLIEKDFPCKDRTEEDKKDTFWELSNDAC